MHLQNIVMKSVPARPFLCVMGVMFLTLALALDGVNTESYENIYGWYASSSSDSVSESTLSFVSEPTVIQPAATTDLEMTCSIQKAESPAPIISLRDSSQSNVDISDLSSVAITRNGIHLASVTQFTEGPTTSAESETNLQITGTIYDGERGGEGFLKLHWTDPTEIQAGAYQCTVRGYSSSGLFVSQSMDVHINTFGQGDLVKRFYDLESKVTQLVEENSRLSTKQEGLEQDNSRLATKQELLEQENSQLSTKQEGLELENSQLSTNVERLEQENSQLQLDISKANAGLMDVHRVLGEVRHIETGRVQTIGTQQSKTSASVNRNWHFSSDSGYVPFQTHRVKFTTPYKTAPIVYVSVVDYDQYVFRYKSYVPNVMKSGYFKVHLDHVDKEGFTIRFQVWWENFKYTTRLTANWISLSKPQ